jgi:hypothetical protein
VGVAGTLIVSTSRRLNTKILDSLSVLICGRKCPKTASESRTFHGVNCDHVDKVVTATDSMKWMSSGLRAPN